MAKGVTNCKKLPWDRQQEVLNKSGIYVARGTCPTEPSKKSSHGDESDAMEHDDPDDLPDLVPDSDDEREADWGDPSSSEEEVIPELPTSHCEMAPYPIPKRRKLRMKTSSQRCGFLQDPNVFACIPEDHPDCRLSRDLSDKVSQVAWGQKKQKPGVLCRYGESNEISPMLSAIHVKADGNTYYSASPLHRSASIRWMTMADESDLETMASRVDLLLSPSITRPFIDEDVAVEWDAAEVDAYINEFGVDPFDGIGWLSPAAYSYLMQIPMDQIQKTYAAIQFRGFLFNRKLQQTALCKGMLMIDSELGVDGEIVISLEASCVKMRKSGFHMRQMIRWAIDSIAVVVFDRIGFFSDVTKTFAFSWT